MKAGEAGRALKCEHCIACARCVGDIYGRVVRAVSGDTDPVVGDRGEVRRHRVVAGREVDGHTAGAGVGRRNGVVQRGRDVSAGRRAVVGADVDPRGRSSLEPSLFRITRVFADTVVSIKLKFTMLID